MKKLLKYTAMLLAFTFLIVFAACGGGKEENDGGTVDVTSVSLDKTEGTLKIGESLQLSATVAPTNATNKTVTWSSSADSVATVENGAVTAVATGTATITATAGGKSAACEVTVLKESNKITIGTEEYDSIEDALEAADDGDTIEISNGTYDVNNTVTVDKSVTLKGEAGHTLIQTTATQTVFAVTAEDVTFDGISITKTDKSVEGSFAMFSMQRDGFTVKNGTFTAQYADGDSEVTRAILPYAGVKDYTIEGNTFKNIRQPAYLEGEGTVKNNAADGTRGWVVCSNYEVDLQNNTFGTNAVDIAIIANGGENEYDEEDTIELSTENNGAYVDNQVLGIKVKDGAKVTE